MVGVFPLIVAFDVVAIEILVAFIDIIVSAIKSKSAAGFSSITENKGVLSASVL